MLFVNPRSGGGAAGRSGLLDVARGRGIKVVVLGAGRDLASLVDEAVADGADALGMAGGDGSLAVVAAAAAAHGLPFICVPAGTRNHFALDLGVDRHDVVGGLEAFHDGLERRIDLARVNGRPFLNNVSLGIYGEAVAQPGYRDAKARTLVETARRVLGPSARIPDARLIDDAGRAHAHLAVVLVSNNPYAVDHPPFGTRPSLDGGVLGILVLDTPGGAPPPGRAWIAPRFEIVPRAPLPAGVDGESVLLEAPLLSFTIQPAALRVRVAATASPRDRVPTNHRHRPGRTSR